MHAIVYETSGQWAALIRRRLSSAVVLVETRNIDETLDQLQGSPCAVVMLQFQSRQGQTILNLLRQMNREFYLAGAVVLADRNLKHWEDLLREAGAIDFIESPRQMGRLIDLIQRQSETALLYETSTDQAISLEKQILAKLPWTD